MRRWISVRPPLRIQAAHREQHHAKAHVFAFFLSAERISKVETERHMLQERRRKLRESLDKILEWLQEHDSEKLEDFRQWEVRIASSTP